MTLGRDLSPTVEPYSCAVIEHPPTVVLVVTDGDEIVCVQSAAPRCRRRRARAAGRHARARGDATRRRRPRARGGVRPRGRRVDGARLVLGSAGLLDGARHRARRHLLRDGERRARRRRGHRRCPVIRSPRRSGGSKTLDPWRRSRSRCDSVQSWISTSRTSGSRRASSSPARATTSASRGGRATSRRGCCARTRCTSPDGNEVVGVSIWESAEARDEYRKSEVESQRRAAMAPYVLEEHSGFYLGRELKMPKGT